VITIISDYYYYIYIYILSYYYILLVYYYCYRSNHWIELPHCWDSQVRHRRPTSGRPPWPAVPNMAFFGVCFFFYNKILKEVIQYQGYKTFFFSVFRVFFCINSLNDAAPSNTTGFHHWCLVSASVESAQWIARSFHHWWCFTKNVAMEHVFENNFKMLDVSRLMVSYKKRTVA